MPYRLLEQEIKDKFYLLNEKGDQVEDACGVPIEIDKRTSQYNTFYYVENMEDEDDYEVFDDLDDALNYIKDNNIELD